MSALRIAVLTDVHGNAPALDAVLADIGCEAPDLTVNLGDVVWGTVDPRGVWERLAPLMFPTVRGNTDEEVGGNEPGVTTAWVRAQLPDGALRELRDLPTTLRVADGEVLLAHGTPDSPHRQFLFEDDEPLPRAETERRLAALPEGVRVVAVGHTHLEAVVRSGNVLAVNVGAVSRQKDGCPDARWALLTRRGGAWSVEFRRTPYDHEEAARLTEARAPKPEKAARNLRTGRRGS